MKTSLIVLASSLLTAFLIIAVPLPPAEASPVAVNMAAPAPNGISLAEIPLKFYFNQNIDIRSVPFTGGGYTTDACKKINGIVPAETAIYITAIKSRGELNSNPFSDRREVGVAVNGEPFYYGDGFYEFTPILLRPGDHYTIEIRASTMTRDLDLIVSGYAFDSNLLF